MGNAASDNADAEQSGGNHSGATSGWDTARSNMQSGNRQAEQELVEEELNRESAAAEGVNDAWQGEIDRDNFLEIAGLRRMLMAGVPITRHVLGVTHPISLFTTKQFDSIFWYHRHSAGVHEYSFENLVEVRPCVNLETGALNALTDELHHVLADPALQRQHGADFSSKAFMLIFVIPKARHDQRQQASALARIGSLQRIGSRQRMPRPGQNGEDPIPQSANRRMSLDQPVPRQLLGHDMMLDDLITPEHAIVSVDIICDDIHTFDMLFDGFCLIRQHYAFIRNSPEYNRLANTATVTDRVTTNQNTNLPRVASHRTSLVMGGQDRDERGHQTGATQALNTLHQLYLPEYHPNHRQKFKIKIGTEVELLYHPKAYEMWYSKRGMEPLKVDIPKNKYFRSGTFCLGTVIRRYPDNTYDVAYVNGPYHTDEDPDNGKRALFPKYGLTFNRVPKSLMIVDYDAQLATRLPWGILLLTLIQVGYFVFYVSRHDQNAQGEVSWTTGVAGDSVLYLQAMGDWPDCQDLIWGKGQYWRLGSYQLVHFGLNHIGFNAFAQLLFGTPIERVHGTFRISLIYQVGVVGAALFTGWSDPMKIVVGASGGVYTILGAHWANLAVNWDAMSHGTVPPVARMLVLSSLMAVDLIQYFFYRSDGTSYAVHLGGWIIGFAGGVLVLRELEVDWCDKYVTRPLALIVFLFMIGFSLYWDPITWPPAQPKFVRDINFGDDREQCCWKVINCEDYFDDRSITWTKDEWSNLVCSGYNLEGRFDDETLGTCSAYYDASQI